MRSAEPAFRLELSMFTMDAMRLSLEKFNVAGTWDAVCYCNEIVDARDGTSLAPPFGSRIAADLLRGRHV